MAHRNGVTGRIEIVWCRFCIVLCGFVQAQRRQYILYMCRVSFSRKYVNATFTVVSTYSKYIYLYYETSVVPICRLSNGSLLRLAKNMSLNNVSVIGLFRNIQMSQ